MTTRNLLETILKMLALLLLIDAVHNAINFSYYFFMDFNNVQEARNNFLASGMSMIFAPLLLSIVLFFSTNFLAKKLAPKNDESRLIVNISAYDLQVIILFSIAVVVALMTLAPLIGFSIEYFLTDERVEHLMYQKAQMIGNFITFVLSIAFAFGAKTLVGWIRYMHYWYGKEDNK